MPTLGKKSVAASQQVFSFEAVFISRKCNFDAPQVNTRSQEVSDFHLYVAIPQLPLPGTWSSLNLKITSLLHQFLLHLWMMNVFGQTSGQHLLNLPLLPVGHWFSMLSIPPHPHTKGRVILSRGGLHGLKPCPHITALLKLHRLVTLLH